LYDGGDIQNQKEEHLAGWYKGDMKRFVLSEEDAVQMEKKNQGGNRLIQYHLEMAVKTVCVVCNAK